MMRVRSDVVLRGRRCVWRRDPRGGALCSDTPLELISMRKVEEDAYFPLRVLAGYSGLSIRTLRSHLTHGSPPLPHYRIGGKIVVKRSEFDAWASAFRVVSNADRTARVIDELLNGLG